MRYHEFLIERKPSDLPQNRLDQLLKACLNKEHVPQDKLQSGLEVAERIYQSVGQKYLEWCVSQYITDRGFFLHDLDAWKDTLQIFQRLSQDKRLVIQRDINKYQNINQLRTEIENHTENKQNIDSLLTRLVPAIDKFVAKGEAKWLYKGNDYCIYTPISYESSLEVKHHMSTTMCTVMKKTAFDWYSDGGILFYTITPDKLYNCFIRTDGDGKFEEEEDYLHYTPNYESEGRDAKNDDTYNIEWQLNTFPKLKEIVKDNISSNTELSIQVQCLDLNQNDRYDYYLEAVSKNAVLLGEVPLDDITYDMCMSAVAQRPETIIFVPEMPYVEDIFLEAVKGDASLIKIIPERYTNAEIWNAAVLEIPPAIADAPTEYINYEMALKAIEYDSRFICYVPSDLDMYAELCLLAVEDNCNTIYDINLYRLDHKMAHKICLTAIRDTCSDDRFLLDYIPEELKNYEICLAAVTENGRALQFVPKELRDYGIYLAAVDNYEDAVEDVPKQYRDRIKQELGL